MMEIDLNSMARTVEVDNRISLRNYYRIADNLLKQASIYREEKNVIDLYIILLRYSSLVSETIPFHRDYLLLLPEERKKYKKKLSSVLDEVESLKPEFLRRLDELKRACSGSRLLLPGAPELSLFSSETSSLERPAADRNSYLSVDMKQHASVAPQSSWKYHNHHSQGFSSNSMQIEKQFQKLSFGVPPPKKETLSRHSFLGPNGLQGQWLGPSADIKVQYPNNINLNPTENPGLDQAGQYGLMPAKDGDPVSIGSTMESVLSLDDGRWLRTEESCSPLVGAAMEEPFQLVKQPSIPPVLAQLQQDVTPIPPSKVADPRPGSAKPSQNGMPVSGSYQHLHVPVKMMEEFLRLAQENTQKNLETCGVLAGSLKNRVFLITTLIIPKQESTSDSCQTLNEEEIFEVQDKLSLFPLGWIHTHPSQTCFMSSVDLCTLITHIRLCYQKQLQSLWHLQILPVDENRRVQHLLNKYAAASG